MRLAEVLKSSDYCTAVFVGGFVLDRRFGLDQGPDVYDSPFDLRGPQGIDPADLKRPAEEVSRAAMQWLDINSDLRFFVFIQFFDLHTPYILTPAMRGRANLARRWLSNRDFNQHATRWLIWDEAGIRMFFS